ncbi:MAG: M20 family metallopeptidase, partial [Candidatus Bathyarchaeia archaeon]
MEIEEALPSRPSVIGSLERGRGPSLLWNGHMDVVPPGSRWTVDPFSGEVRNGKIYGRGAADMKGALVAMLMAAKALTDSGAKLRGKLLLTAVSDEEALATGTRNLIEKGYASDMAIVGEPSNLEICVSHKGGFGTYLATKGRTAHASRPEEGVNAITKMMKIVLALENFKVNLSKKEHPLLGHPTLSINLIEGGIKENMVPDLCKIYIDRRSIPGETQESWLRELNGVLDPLREGDKELEVNVSFRYPFACLPMETPINEKIVLILKNVVRRVLGREAVISGFGAFSDASFLRNDAKIPTVIFGPGRLSQAHAPDEYVEIEQLMAATKIYALTTLEA